MNNVLMLMSQVVYPADDGGKQAIYYRMEKLEAITNLSIMMVNSANRVIDNEWVKKFRQIKVLEQILKPSKECSKLELFKQILSWIFSGKPRQSLVNRSKQIKMYIMKYIQEKKVETVVLELPYVAELVDVERLHKWGVKVVVVVHNVEHLYFEDTNTWPSFLKRIEYNRICRYEKNILNTVDCSIGISPWDVLYFREKIGVDNIKYLPAYLPVPKQQWSMQNNEEKYIIFCGTLSFKPNLQGIIWFLDKVFSKYQQRHPEVYLKITGKVSEETRNLLKYYSKVELTGYLSEEELHCVMLNSLFAVVPILSGSGVKIKLLESMSYGIPTITTLHGYQGVEFSERKEPPFLVAKDENDFLHYMCGLTDGSINPLELGETARRYFEATYASEENIENWLSVMCD